MKGSVFLLKGNVKSLAPLVIAKGKGESLDIELLTDKSGRFFIPGTSFKGALKHYFEDAFEDKELISIFFGNHKKESLAFFEDLTLKNEHITSTRDGIKLNEYMTVEHGAKFDYEILVPDREFEFGLFVEASKDIDKVRSILKTIIQELSNENIKIGAFTSKGFGLLKLTDYKLYRFDFPSDIKAYFNYLKSHKLENVKLDSLEDVQTLRYKAPRVIFEGRFEIKNSLIIRKQDIHEEADSVHITTKDKHTITGSSLKGALRARATRIAKTVGISENIVNEVFGSSKNSKKKEDEKNEKPKRQKARLIVNECYIEKDNVISEMVHRINIDRFTGGVKETALMSSKPIWHKKEMLNIKLELEEAKEAYIGLLLLVLKDLWNEDLALGGEKSIGRGVLKGSYLKIKTKDGEFEISKEGDRLNIKGKEKLEHFVKALKEYKEEL
ncbi:RAMP superfamily CRISPR-associated protein [Hydrogenobaculum acidophilum]